MLKSFSIIKQLQLQYVSIITLTILAASTIYLKSENVETGYSFTEGPAVDSDGKVYFTDQPNDRIYVWEEGISKMNIKGV